MVIVPSERLRVIVVGNENSAPMAIQQLMDNTQDDLKVFGLDCEWDLVTTKGTVHKPDILQIATVQGFCAIFRLHQFKKTPPCLKGFLEDPYFAKVGVGVVEDSDKLHRCFGVDPQGVVDVRHVADELNIPPRGLSHLSKTVLGVELAKHHYSFHQWTGRLTAKQKLYAALDGIFSARVFYKLSHTRLVEVYGDEWMLWDHREYHERTMALWDKYFSKPFDYSRCNFYIRKMIEIRMTLGDLNPRLLDESGDEFAAPVETQDPEELPDFPTFKAKFAKAKKAKKTKKVPKRYLKRFVRRVESQGIDPKTIPAELLPKSVLDDEGKIDLTKI